SLASVRLGKFLTPIGRWNLIHAAPLVWTTSRPLVTVQPFSSDVTGAMIYGTVFPLGREITYSLYGEATNELDPDSSENPFTEAVGLHIVSHITDATELGISYANFTQEKQSHETQNLFGLDFQWARRQYELTGEFAYRWGEHEAEANEWGIFIQGV